MALEDLEPAPKRIKIANPIEEQIDKYLESMNNGSQKNLTPIMDDDYHNPIPLMKVTVGVINNPKDISKTIITLNEKVSMKDMQHLKRVHKKEVIICPVDYLNGLTTQEFINKKVEDLKDVFVEFKEVAVPSQVPKVRKQFDEANLVWPCNFHPNKYNEQLVSGCFFTDEELIAHRQYMAIAFEVTKFYLRSLNEKNIDPEKILKELNSSVVVDPSTKSVVAISFDNRVKHPIQHSAMLAIDNVAKTQNGGAWITDREKQKSIDTTLKGIDDVLLLHLKAKFPHTKFGAKVFKSKREITEKQKELLEDSDIGPYLCTGYYVYMLKEPCVMCSMALVHARAKRVFFCFENTELGALKSKVKLQTVSSLNHHFEVFTGFL